MAALQTTITGTRNQLEPAVIRDVEPIEDGLSWFTQWFPKMYDLSGERLFEDSHWDVPGIWTATSKDERYRAMVLEASGQIQGYVVFQLKEYGGIDQEPCMHVSFLATAPWNRKRKGGIREYRGVGSALLAVSLLYELKNIGKLVLELHSLPLSEHFYRKLGFADTGRVHEGLRLMRMERPEALKLLRPFLSSFMRGEVKL